MLRLFAIAFLGLLTAGVSPATAEESRPNVIVIVVDNLGWADLGCYGSKFHKTPNIDRLAQRGIRFTQAYAAAPIGQPTRAAILTGRYPQRMNLTASVAADPHDSKRRLTPPDVAKALPLEEVTIAEALKAAGYATGCIGKWHLGGEGFGPKEQGFDVSVAAAATGAIYSDFAPYVDVDGKPIPGLEQAPAGEYLTDRLALEAAKFVKSHQAKPFFLYLPHFAVHLPAAVKPEIQARYGEMPNSPNGKQINPLYAALLESLDQAVGHLERTLDELDLSRKTLIILTSDNGGACNHRGQIVPATSNAPLRDGMGHLHEGGIRVPLIIKGPGLAKTGDANTTVVSCLDLFPTILEACLVPQSPAVSSSKIDGQSLLPLLRGSGPLTRDAIYWHYPHYNVNDGAKPGGAVRQGDWKLIEFFETGRRELFNVAAEPGESANLIEKHADVADRLSASLKRWRESVGARLPAPNPNYQPNLQLDDGTVTLHSSTADVEGVMLRYEPLPNKDTLGYWVRQEDWARFEFTLKRPGRFHVVANVGCGTAGGSLVDFVVGEHSLSLKVPATGHFQNFLPQDLGLVTFEKAGRFTLDVKPRVKDGVAVMDLRQIELRPVSVAEMLPDLHLLHPFWKSSVVYRESAICVNDGVNQPATAKLLFPATRIIAVQAANGLRAFQSGTDFQVAENRQQLVRAETSPIPVLKSTDLFMPKGARPVWTGGPDSAVPCALPHKVGDPETHILFDNGHWFHDQQIEVTYERAGEAWPTVVPKFDPEHLPKTIARLKAKQPLKIAVSGDSISFGLNASGLVGAPPFMPMYPDLVAAQLRASYGGDITLVNRAIGGWGVPNGIADLDALLAVQPDLVIIAYGMNDVGRRNPDGYQAGIRDMLTRIKAARPDAEVILVATMVGNDQWVHTPREMFPEYRDRLIQLTGEGIALADLTSIWTEMLRRKRDCDLTGNGVNHPSDFGHRVYASAILSLLVE
ncbi:sulfatase-like hydrolase/transferase [Schlesneria paludicola]|uniref:sulfatase-like hydrolase/transferase n=1 Tax=Schlesneria paludicola TaxID=360056 RepID=UPI001ED91E51|nr:sulfatase-like hydrolase/transferase [Schlesneria paludicola]